MPKPISLVESKVEPNPTLEKRTRRVFTAEYKLSIIRQADACKHGEVVDEFQLYGDGRAAGRIAKKLLEL